MNVRRVPAKMGQEKLLKQNQTQPKLLVVNFAVTVLRLEVCVLDFSDASRVENSIFEESRLSLTFVSLCNYLNSEWQSLKNADFQ